MDIESDAFRSSLAELFSGYRAEWLKGEVFELFTEPSYFPQLTTSHPCFLVGGRGTGKTTALRCLSYEGQEALRSATSRDPGPWAYFGMYYRINTNRVRAFGGEELPEASWSRLFGHYVNLELCELVLTFLEWYGRGHPDEPALNGVAVPKIAASLSLSGVTSQTDLRHGVALAKLKFEAAINNIADDSNMPLLSLQGAPVDALLREVSALPQFAGKSFFFLIDEYENLDGLQQRVFNTLIKHCGDLYSFKVGVKELGFRERATLNPHERLSHPADYKLIDISEELSTRFSDFATRVCTMRLERILGDAATVPDVHFLFPDQSAEEEAIALGVQHAADQILSLASGQPGAESVVEACAGCHPFEIYAMEARARAEGLTLAAKAEEVLKNRQKWREQYENYKYAYLFSIRRGKRGIRKYYSGWRAYCTMAATNMRFLLELVDQALNIHLESGGAPLDPVSFEAQTRAAQQTGRKNLRELEGVALSGAKLTRLLLGLGRIFEIMAEDSVGHTPEVTQFCLDAEVRDEVERRRVDELVTEGIVHLALLRYTGSKLQEPGDIRQFDYALHPIFAPFFGYSYRRKRKIELSDRDLLDIVESPASTIKSILGRQNRTSDIELPEQLTMFAGFYAISN